MRIARLRSRGGAMAIRRVVVEPDERPCHDFGGSRGAFGAPKLKLRVGSAAPRFHLPSTCKEIPMEEPTQGIERRNKAWQRIAITAFLVALLGLVLMSLPRGFDTDLSMIGAGKPAVVFVYDPNLLVSNQQTRELDVARESLGDALHFLIADVGRPEGQGFMRQHQASATQLLLFAPDGRVLRRMQALVSSDQLIESVAAAGAGD